MKKLFTALGVLAIAMIALTSFLTENEVEQTLSQNQVVQKATNSVTGVVYETDNEGRFTRIRSAATAELEIGDAKDIRIAIQKATMRAKANIVKFFKEDVTSDEVLDSLEKSKKTNQEKGEENIIRETVESYAAMIKNNASKLLKGVIVTKTSVNKAEKTVEVEVGFSPKTRKMADELNGKVTPSSTLSDMLDGENEVK